MRQQDETTGGTSCLQTERESQELQVSNQKMLGIHSDAVQQMVSVAHDEHTSMRYSCSYHNMGHALICQKAKD